MSVQRTLTLEWGSPKTKSAKRRKLKRFLKEVEKLRFLSQEAQDINDLERAGRYFKLRIAAYGWYHHLGCPVTLAILESEEGFEHPLNPGEV